MRLIDQDARIFAQHEVVLYLLHEDTVCHKLDFGRIANVGVVEANLVAYLFTELCVELVTDTVGETDGGDPARLCNAYHRVHLSTTVELPGAHLLSFIDKLGDLGGLARSRLTAHNRHHKVFNILHYFALMHHDRQLRLIRKKSFYLLLVALFGVV